MIENIKLMKDRKKIQWLYAGGIFLICIFATGCLGNLHSDNTSLLEEKKIPLNKTPILITVDPISQQRSGDTFTVSGITNISGDQQVLVFVHEEFLPRKSRSDGTFYGLMGNATLIEEPDGISRWSFNVNTTGWPSQKYYLEILTSNDDSVLNSSEFYLLPSREGS